jgi:hypothetical protein
MGEAAEKLTHSTAKTVPHGLIPWKPGQSGNPGGRPKGLATFIREQTKDGEELALLLLAVARGQEKAFCKWSERLKAIEMLLDRGGWPKSPILSEDPSNLPKLDLSMLTPQEINALEQFGSVLAAVRDRLTSGETPTKS